MNGITLTNEQARAFLLRKHGLAGARRFAGKPGVCAFIRQVGCIQFDPIDVCGRNSELVLQSRVEGFSKAMLEELLYSDRRLVDYFDKNLAIIGVEDWPYFGWIRRRYLDHGDSRQAVDAIADEVRQLVREKGVVCARDLQLSEKVDWPWAPTSLARAALETLYFRGELVIDHKKGTVKYYRRAEEAIDGSLLAAADPFESDEERERWQVLRRIGAVGLLWERPSDAWLGIPGLKSEERRRDFAALRAADQIRPCQVEGVKEPLYYRSEDEALLMGAAEEETTPARLEFIAPLDNLLWDRNLMRALFHFDYKWEIYTPVEQRKYGYYVLPVLYGRQFVGRIELRVEKKERLLRVANYWPEADITAGKGFNEGLRDGLERFARFNGCERVEPNPALP